MSGINQENRKKILDVLRNERNEIQKLLKQKSSGSQKRISQDKQKEQIVIHDQAEEQSNLFQQQNLFNQIPSNSNSKRNSILSEDGDLNQQGSEHNSDSNALSAQNYNYTFNKYHNQILLDQMKLSKEQIEENQRYLNRDMIEQDQELEEDEDEDELNEVNNQNHYNQQEQHFQEDDHQYQNSYYQNASNNQHLEYENQQQSSQYGEQYQGEPNYNQVKHDNFLQLENAQNKTRQKSQNQNKYNANSQKENNSQQKYFISDKPVKNQESLRVNKSHQDLTHNKRGKDEQVKNAKNTVKDLKNKLLNLKEQKDKKQKELIQHRIEDQDKKKHEHIFHAQCKLSSEQELLRKNIHKDPLTEEERCSAWLRLYDDKKQFYEQNEQEKKRIEETKIIANCSKNPEINLLSKVIAENKNKENNLPVEERLNLEAMKYRQKVQKQQYEKQQKETEDLTFKPQIYSQPLQQKPPIYERFTEIAKKKQEIIHQLKLKEQSTFQPQINPKSAEIAETKINNKDVAERLNQEFFEQQKRKEKLQTQVYEEVNKECKFHPQTNPASIQIAKQLPLYDGRADVVQRQQVLEKQSRDKKQRVAQELEKDKCSFKPEINQISEILVYENQGRLTETQDQKIERMYKKEIEMRKMKNEQRQKEYESQMTFTPSINEVSRYIVNDKSRDLDELAYNFTGKMHIKMLQEEKEFEKMKECSFYPSTSQSIKYMHVPAYYNQEKCHKSVKMEVQTKEKKLREQKKQYINKELKECTFTPTINKNKKVDKKQNIDRVKGLENFLQNKDRAERQKQERIHKEDQVFNIHKRYDTETRQSYTKPQPFKLSHYNKQQLSVQ
ncbi:hypothetical protein ABPG74_011209 [Tetrahymena malaccensis]